MIHPDRAVASRLKSRSGAVPVAPSLGQVEGDLRRIRAARGRLNERPRKLRQRCQGKQRTGSRGGQDRSESFAKGFNHLGSAAVAPASNSTGPWACSFQLPAVLQHAAVTCVAPGPGGARTHRGLRECASTSMSWPLRAAAKRPTRSQNPPAGRKGKCFHRRARAHLTKRQTGPGRAQIGAGPRANSSSPARPRPA